MAHEEQNDPVAQSSMYQRRPPKPTTSTADLSERDNKENWLPLLSLVIARVYSLVVGFFQFPVPTERVLPRTPLIIRTVDQFTKSQKPKKPQCIIQLPKEAHKEAAVARRKETDTPKMGLTKWEGR